MPRTAWPTLPADSILLTGGIPCVLHMLTDILKCKGCGHLLSEACRESPNLGVDVGEVRQGRPPTDAHDGAVGCTTQLHGHGASRPEAVG